MSTRKPLSKRRIKARLKQGKPVAAWYFVYYKIKLGVNEKLKKAYDHYKECVMMNEGSEK